MSKILTNNDFVSKDLKLGSNFNGSVLFYDDENHTNICKDMEDISKCNVGNNTNIKEFLKENHKFVPLIVVYLQGLPIDFLHINTNVNMDMLLTEKKEILPPPTRIMPTITSFCNQNEL